MSLSDEVQAELVRRYVHDELGWPYWALEDSDELDAMPNPVPTGPPLDTSGVWASFREARQAALDACALQRQALDARVAWLTELTPGAALQASAEEEGWTEAWRPADWTDADEPPPVEVRYRIIGNGRPTSPRALQCQLCDAVLPDMTTSTAEAHSRTHEHPDPPSPEA